MPKRIVDGEAVWSSDKLLQIEPPAARAEFANLLPLALANGVFECDARKIFAKVYAYNRPDMTVERVTSLLEQFRQARMLFTWRDESGKEWGHWVGSDKPGRLPGAARLHQKGEKVGPPIPTDKLDTFLGSKRDVSGAITERNNGFGLGSGLGRGEGAGSGSGDSSSLSSEMENQETRPTTDEIDRGRAFRNGQPYPANWDSLSSDTKRILLAQNRVAPSADDDGDEHFD